MGLRFTKMHGLGNDYIYVSLFDDAPNAAADGQAGARRRAAMLGDVGALARAISDRHRGVGSDGLILIAPPDGADADVRMMMYNADGSRGEMCGNGIRCVARYAYERGLARRNPLRIATDAGVRIVVLRIDANQRVESVRVDMGAPRLRPAQIPVALSGERVICAPVPLAEAALEMTCVSMGNPHAVIFVTDLDAVPLARWGRQIEQLPLFPQRVNVHFVQVLNRQRVRMATWERGSGITQACGTGASAVCVAGVLCGITDRAISAQLPGGELQLEWDAATDNVFMTGPAEFVCDGEWLGP